MGLSDLSFFIIAGVTVASALGVVISKNIIHSALFLVLTFLGVAAVYFQLNAVFIGLVQILVYAGAISVIIIFAIMLVMDDDVEKTNLANPATRYTGLAIAVLFLFALGGAIWTSNWPNEVGTVTVNEMALLAHLLLGDYVIAFELAAILLLIAVVGAIILAKGAKDQ